MKTKIKYNYARGGFTLVEILAVLVVISILIGLLVPALSAVKKMAGNVRQRSQFSTIEVGLETFNNDFGDYPESGHFSDVTTPGGEQYCGAQKLGEAMVGLDGFGFHKDSVFRHDGYDSDDPIPKLLYDIYTPRMLDEDLKASIAKRKGPYLELETANAIPLRFIYPLATFPSPPPQLLDYESFVLADKFGLMKNAATGKKTGKPILYFRANTNETNLPLIYKYGDNMRMVDLDPASNPMNNLIFEAKIKNPNFEVTNRPYRAESFILVSAGADGLYGTADDVYNFDVEN